MAGTRQEAGLEDTEIDIHRLIAKTFIFYLLTLPLPPFERSIPNYISDFSINSFPKRNFTWSHKTQQMPIRCALPLEWWAIPWILPIKSVYFPPSQAPALCPHDIYLLPGILQYIPNCSPHVFSSSNLYPKRSFQKSNLIKFLLFNMSYALTHKTFQWLSFPCS